MKLKIDLLPLILRQKSCSFDVIKIQESSLGLIQRVRETNKPECLILNNASFALHSKSDDGRLESEIEEWKNGSFINCGKTFCKH